MTFLLIVFQIHIDGNDIDTNVNEAFQALGYCPQKDAIWEDITLREHLKCYALIKGVKQEKIDDIILQ